MDADVRSGYDGWKTGLAYACTICVQELFARSNQLLWATIWGRAIIWTFQGQSKQQKISGMAFQLDPDGIRRAVPKKSRYFGLSDAEIESADICRSTNARTWCTPGRSIEMEFNDAMSQVLRPVGIQDGKCHDDAFVSCPACSVIPL
jgi:hypothetical protein